MEQLDRESQNKKLHAAQTLTDEVRTALEKFLRAQIGDPRGCGKFFGSVPGYPDREDVKRAVNAVWDGLHALYRLDPVAYEQDWCATWPFISNMDDVWVLGGSVSLSEQPR